MNETISVRESFDNFVHNRYDKNGERSAKNGVFLLASGLVLDAIDYEGVGDFMSDTAQPVLYVLGAVSLGFSVLTLRDRMRFVRQNIGKLPEEHHGTN